MHLDAARATFPSCVLFFTHPCDMNRSRPLDLPLMMNDDASTVPDDVDEGETGVTLVTVAVRPPDILC